MPELLLQADISVARMLFRFLCAFRCILIRFALCHQSTSEE